MSDIYEKLIFENKEKQYAYQPAEELTSLEHLRKIGVNI